MDSSGAETLGLVGPRGCRLRILHVEFAIALYSDSKLSEVACSTRSELSNDYLLVLRDARSCEISLT